MIVLFDIDGTLVENNLYPNNFDSIKQLIIDLKSQGVLLGLCSCRSFDSSVRKVYKDYALNGPIITECGGCKYQKQLFKYKLQTTYLTPNFNLNKLLKKSILTYTKKNNLNIAVKVSSLSLDNRAVITINKKRKASSTIRLPESLHSHIKDMVDMLKAVPQLADMTITVDKFHPLKILVYAKDVLKISAIENYFKNTSVVLVTNYEEVKSSSYSPLLKIYGVGLDKEFNVYCDKTFSPFGKGVEEILNKLQLKGKKL